MIDISEFMVYNPINIEPMSPDSVISYPVISRPINVYPGIFSASITRKNPKNSPKHIERLERLERNRIAQKQSRAIKKTEIHKLKTYILELEAQILELKSNK